MRKISEIVVLLQGTFKEKAFDKWFLCFKCSKMSLEDPKLSN